MTHSQAKQSNWLSLLLLCFSLQAMLPSGYMLGSGEQSFVTLCTSDGLSTLLIDAFDGDEPSGHQADTLCLKTLNNDIPLLTASALSLFEANNSLNTFESGDLALPSSTKAYLSRAPPLPLS